MQIPIELTSPENKTEGIASVVVWSKKQAMKKGLRWMGACWGMALLALPIPFVHFVAVPGLLLSGPLIGTIVYKVHNAAKMIEVANGPCPSCGQEVRVKDASATWPVTASCTQCSGKITLAPLGNLP
jgi:hypothetical protein